MANTTLNMTLLLRRAAFNDACVLQAGEPGYHTGTKEFKIGDGSTTWANLKVANEVQIRSWISDLESTLEGKITANTNKFNNYYTKSEIDNLLSALESSLEALITAEATARENADNALQTNIDAKLATADFNSWKSSHEADHAGTATEITAEITTAVNGEKALREAADKDITDTLGTGFDKGDNTVAKKIAAAEAAAKAHAEEKATKAYTDAVAEAESKDAARATTTATNLANAVSALETKITNGDSATLQSAKGYTDEQVAAEAELRIAADNALDGRLDIVEAKLTNVSNVMDFVGAAEALPAEGNNQNGDVIVITAGDNVGKEFVYDDSREVGKKWVEFGSTSATDAAVAGLKSRMDAAEGDIDQAQADIIALGTNKLNTSDFNTWKQSHEADHANKQEVITSAIATAKGEAITEAGRLDGELETKLIGGDADTTYAKTIKGAKDYAKAYADGLATNYDASGAAATAEQNAKNYADSQDIALKTAIEGTAADTSSVATIAGAKKYAEEKAAAAEKAAKDYADGLSDNYDAAGAAADAKAEVIGESGDAKTADTIYGAKAFATDAANTAEQNAINTVVGTAESDADSDTIKGVRKAFAAADVTTLTSAQTYADTVAANAVKNNIKSGNDDIVITRPDSGDDAGKTVISHKVYGTGEYTKPDSVSDANFVTGIQIENGHVTGATVKSLAEALSAMTFIFDGGTSAN